MLVQEDRWGVLAERCLSQDGKYFNIRGSWARMLRPEGSMIQNIVDIM